MRTFASFQAIGGFLLVVTADCEVFFASHAVEQYIGFHQVELYVFSGDILRTQFSLRLAETSAIVQLCINNHIYK